MGDQNGPPACLLCPEYGPLSGFGGLEFCPRLRVAPTLGERDLGFGVSEVLT